MTCACACVCACRYVTTNSHASFHTYLWTPLKVICQVRVTKYSTVVAVARRGQERAPVSVSRLFSAWCGYDKGRLHAQVHEKCGQRAIHPASIWSHDSPHTYVPTHIHYHHCMQKKAEKTCLASCTCLLLCKHAGLRVCIGIYRIKVLFFSISPCHQVYQGHDLVPWAHQTKPQSPVGWLVTNTERHAPVETERQRDTLLADRVSGRRGSRSWRGSSKETSLHWELERLAAHTQSKDVRSAERFQDSYNI